MQNVKSLRVALRVLFSDELVRSLMEHLTPLLRLQSIVRNRSPTKWHRSLGISECGRRGYRGTHVGLRNPQKIFQFHESNFSEDLEEFRQRLPKVTAEDEIIRRFIRGTWHRIFASEVIFATYCTAISAYLAGQFQLVIKRRGNLVVLTGIIDQRTMARKIYWLIGYTEELLACLLKQPVKMELQTISDREQIVFKYI